MGELGTWASGTLVISARKRKTNGCLKYSGGTTFNLRFDKRLLPAGYAVIGSCIEQVTYFDMENGYRLNVRERGFGSYSYTAVDITRTDWAHAFAVIERQSVCELNSIMAHLHGN